MIQKKEGSKQELQRPEIRKKPSIQRNLAPKSYKNPRYTSKSLTYIKTNLFVHFGQNNARVVCLSALSGNRKEVLCDGVTHYGNTKAPMCQRWEFLCSAIENGFWRRKKRVMCYTY